MHVALAVLAALLLCAPATGAAQAPETLFNLVGLSAQAEREVPNDLMTAVLAAEAEGTDPAALADGVNRVMQRALATALAYRQVKSQSGGFSDPGIPSPAAVPGFLAVAGLFSRL